MIFILGLATGLVQCHEFGPPPPPPPEHHFQPPLPRPQQIEFHIIPGTQPFSQQEQSIPVAPHWQGFNPPPPPDFYAPAKYDYGYNIYDPVSGDIKNQYEERLGEFVKGGYSFVEPDGHRRIVEYTADPYRGFNALVRRVLLPPYGGR